MIFLTTRPKTAWSLFDANFDWITDQLDQITNSHLFNYEINQDENNYLISVDLPGVQKQDISLDLKGDQLTLSAERRPLSLNTKQITRQRGAYQKTFTIPQGVEMSKISADYQNGVLLIQIPRPNVTSLTTKITIK